MLRGLYAGASGMIAGQMRLDTIANNLANVATAGYKGSVPVFEAYLALPVQRVEAAASRPIGALGTGTQLAATAVDWTQGPLQPTGRALDVALDGPGFFVLDTAAGPRYTRDGHFLFSPDGQLITANGEPVLGSAGPLRLADPALAAQARFTRDGRLLAGQREVGQLAVVQFPQAQGLEREGGNRWRATAASGAAQPVAPRVLPGTLEGSNVDAVREMVQMITVLRAYEAGQKALQAQDETLGRAVNEVARLA